MRFPFFGFGLSDNTRHRTYEDKMRAALVQAGYGSIDIATFPRLAATGDSSTANTASSDLGDLVFSGAVPGVPNPTQLLQKFAHRAMSQTLSSADVPHGSFVLAYQNHPGELSLITDGFGTMPIFVMPFAGGVWFSNDAKILFKLSLKFTIRPLSLPEGLHRLVPPPPLSHFKEILSVPSSGIMTVDLRQGTVSSRKYHNFETRIDAPSYLKRVNKSDSDLEQELETHLGAAVKASVEPYEKVGLLLSGGVDSSLLAYFAHKHTSVVAVHVDQPEDETELKYAQSVAGKLGIDLNVINFSQHSFRQNFVASVYEQAQPFFIANGMGLQHATRSGAFVDSDILIDGEGADFPMFSGGIQKASLWRYFLNQNLGLPKSMFEKSTQKMSGLLKKLGYSTNIAGESDGLHKVLCARLIEDDKVYAQFQTRFEHITEPLEQDLATQVLQGYESSLQNLLTRLDPASRLAGKHTIFPFLHPEYVAFTMNMPASFKIRKRKGLVPKMELKWLAKKVAARHLPKDAIFRPKVGFGMPAGLWIGTFPAGLSHNSWIKEFFELSDSGFEHLLTKIGSSENLYFLTALEVWGRLFDRRNDVEDVKILFDQQ